MFFGISHSKWDTCAAHRRCHKARMTYLSNSSSLSRRLVSIEGIIKNYPWGSRETLARHRGVPESEVPEAELWFGDNPQGPSIISGTSTSLDELTRALGNALPRGQLPFLAKILAVEQSLSLQVHPALEDIPSLQNVCKDQNHKPEMVVALTEFQAFVGFADIEETLELLENLHSEKVNVLITEPLRAGISLTEILDNLLGVDDTTDVLQEVQQCLTNIDSIRGKWMQELINLYAPKLDPLATLLCELVTLHPGESIYLPPKCVHAYLNGTVVEVMANSDNVLRGGLTHKPIDKGNFLKVVDSRSGVAARITPTITDVSREWKPPILDFALQEFQGSINTDLMVENYAIAFAWQGATRISTATGSAEHVDVHHATGALITPGKYTLVGSGSLWVATGKGR